jgi:transcriptional regulator with XRE-family HTH domain
VVASGNALGDFLKARRDQVQPAEVGLPVAPRRRVPGLRREELAGLAGISADYYLRIEQGRAASPSAQVLDALARALRLDNAATAHMHALAAGAPEAPVERVDPALVVLVEQLSVPAFVAGRYQDCLASNALASRLSPAFSPGCNMLRQLFVDPAQRELHIDWDDATAGVVGGLRQVAGTTPHDPRLLVLVDEMTASSERFAMLWARADVGFRPAGGSHLRHPEVGELHLHRQRFDIPDSGGQHLHLYSAEPGSESERRLERLRDQILRGAR